MTLGSLPLVDLSLLDNGSESAEALGEQLRTITHDVGFFYLIGHAIPDDVIARAFSTARDFFALPLEEKLRLEMTRSPHFRGYTRTGGELTQGEVDWREQLDLGDDRDPVDDPGAPPYLRLEGPNLWPAAQPQVREVFTDWADRCTVIGTRLLRAWAWCLGSPSDTFEPAFAHRPSTLVKLVRYPGRSTAEDFAQGVGAHKDPGVLTLLMIEPGKAGLQVEHEGRWIDAPAVPGAFVVNIGELLEYATQGYLKATMHRVVSPPPGDVRLSIPFFFNPSLDSRMPLIDLPAELAARARGVSQDPDNIISGTFGDNLLKARLRAHPDVAAIHHADLLR